MIEPQQRTSPSAIAPAVRATKVGKTFGSGALAFEALRDVDFEVSRGEFVMLVGPSGSGKTTLLSILGCVLTASRGEVDLFGLTLSSTPIRDLPLLRRALIGFVFQGHNLIAALSAEDNVRLVLETRGVAAGAARRGARELLDRVGLAKKFHALPNELSGGQRQRVAIARALAGSPPLVLADEPTAALDAVTGLEVTKLLTELCRERGSTVVVVTHDNRIFHLADRIVHIEDGRIAQPTGRDGDHPTPATGGLHGSPHSP